MSRAILFRKCLGLNDARAFGTQRMVTDPRDPEAGSVELIDCLNLTTTPDACLEKLPPLVTALDTLAAVGDLSASSRLLFTSGTDTKEWTTGTTIVTRFPEVHGPIAHTPLDTRVCHGSSVYKSVNPAVAMAAAGLADISNLPPTSRPFYAMPEFKQAFVYNSKLYAVNQSDPRFIQYSEDYHYDVWNLGDNHIGHAVAILQAGAIPGVLLATHVNGVTVYPGSGPGDFGRRFYPCAPIDKTLYSGFISKVYGHSHVFLCDDGVYAVGPEGQPVNLTADQIDHIDTLNTSYYAATVQNGKYLAFGNLCTLEYDFKTKTLLKRETFGITGACVWNGINYFAAGNTICTAGTEIDTTDDFTCSLTLPFSDMSVKGIKSFDSLYFTGTISGMATFTATDQNGNSWSVETFEELINVSQYRIRVPKGRLGNHVSISISCSLGAFRMEELTATIFGSNRTQNKGE